MFNACNEMRYCFICITDLRYLLLLVESWSFLQMSIIAVLIVNDKQTESKQMNK